MLSSCWNGDFGAPGRAGVLRRLVRRLAASTRRGMPPGSRDERLEMMEGISATREAAVGRIAAAEDAATARTLATELLGKKGPFAAFKVGLGKLATVDEKR